MKATGSRIAVYMDSNLRPGKSSASPILVQIEKPIYGGNFLARHEGKAVFVPLVLPGEQARARVVEEKKGYATAEAEEVLFPSAQRTSPRCPHFGPCGGCQYQHANYHAQLDIKAAVLRETLERAGVKPPETIEILAGEPWAYRNRIRLAFDAQGHPGYHGRRSHAIVPISECPIAAPLLIRCALSAAETIRTVTPALRPTEMALFCNPDETALLLTIFIAQAEKVQFDQLAIELRQRIPQLAGAELVIESAPHRLPRTLAQWGEASLAYRSAGADYRVDHGAFFQVNRWLLDALVERVTAGHNGALAWDLFAGVGLFARKLAQSFAQVVAVESSPAATLALAANLAGTSGNALHSSALDFLRANGRGHRPDFVVVDPPRTGLGADVTALLAGIQPPELTYVSCDPATLARDLRALLAAGYNLESVTLADLFPQTFHLETVVRMRFP
jgi:23S rRNA (uracil1939-C5)-methyltransferase